MSANISAPQLRKKIDELFVLVTALTQELITLKAATITGDLTVGGDLALTGDAAVTGDMDVTGDLGVTGTTTLDGGEVSYAADDSGGAGFRNVLVPNAV